MHNKALDRLRRNLAALGVSRGDKILIAWSGGMDSTLLTYLLSKELNHRVEALYFDHALRPRRELEGEIHFLKKTADNWKIPLILHGVAPGEIEKQASRLKASKEELARNYRYESLGRAFRERQFHWVVTAHHLDDQVETSLHRFFQGSGTMGLGSIKKSLHWGYPIIRPLWDFSRNDIEALTKHYGLPYSQDSSNQDEAFARNRLRLGIIPEIKGAYPSLGKSIRKACEKNDLHRDFISQSLKEVPGTAGPGFIGIPKKAFEELHGALRMEWLYRSADTLLKDKRRGYRIPYGFFRSWVMDNRGEFPPLEGHGLRIRSWKGEIQMLDLSLITQPLEPKSLRYQDRIEAGSYRVELLENRENPQVIGESQGSLELPVPRGMGLFFGTPRQSLVWKKPGYRKKRQSQYPPEQRKALVYLFTEEGILFCLNDSLKRISRDWQDFLGRSFNRGTPPSFQGILSIHSIQS